MECRYYRLSSLAKVLLHGKNTTHTLSLTHTLTNTHTHTHTHTHTRHTKNQFGIAVFFLDLAGHGHVALHRSLVHQSVYISIIT